MNRLGIQTGADLRSQPVEFLTQHFGKSGPWYYAISRGEDDRPVRPDRERKSSGSETTFAPDLTIAPPSNVKCWDRPMRFGRGAERPTHSVGPSPSKSSLRIFQQATRSRSLTAPVSSLAVLHEMSLGLIRSVLPTQKAFAWWACPFPTSSVRKPPSWISRSRRPPLSLAGGAALRWALPSRVLVRVLQARGGVTASRTSCAVLASLSVSAAATPAARQA